MVVFILWGINIVAFVGGITFLYSERFLPAVVLMGIGVLLNYKNLLMFVVPLFYTLLFVSDMKKRYQKINQQQEKEDMQTFMKSIF